MIGPLELNGHELRELRKLLGRPFTAALADSDEDAMFAYVWIAERRDNPTLTFDDVLSRPFAEIVELATPGIGTEEDPTIAGSG